MLYSDESLLLFIGLASPIFLKNMGYTYSLNTFAIKISSVQHFKKTPQRQITKHMKDIIISLLKKNNSTVMVSKKAWK